MALISPRRRARSRWAVLAAVVATVALITGSIVLALAGSTFESADGNLAAGAGHTDWDNVAAKTTQTDLIKSTKDDAFGQGTKEDNAAVSVVLGSIPPQKSDLSAFHTFSEKAGSSQFLYLAWERTNQLGSANMDFELNQQSTDFKVGTGGATAGSYTINRTAGDLLFTFDFGGSGAPSLGMLVWATAAQTPAPIGTFTTNTCYSANSFPCWADRQDLVGSGWADGAVNTSTVTDGTTSLPANTFGEMGVNLSLALPNIFGSGATSCESLGSAMLKTRSSSSFPAEVKDFIAPEPISVSNCGTIKITKNTVNADGTFDFTSTAPASHPLGSPADASGDFSLTTTSNTATTTFSDVFAGSYSVSEDTSALETDWSFTGLVCTDSGGASHSINSATASITMVAGGEVDCTYTNKFKDSPTLATQLKVSPGGADISNPIAIGTTLYDTASLTGAAGTPGGSITYKVYSDDACSTLVEDVTPTTATLSGGVIPDSKTRTFNAAGDFWYRAHWTGDSNNNAADSVCTDEPVTVSKNTPTLSTQLKVSGTNASIVNPITIGTTLYDTATLGSLAGTTPENTSTITYKIYNLDTCAAASFVADVTPSTATLSGGIIPNSATHQFNSAGSFWYQAVWSGDSNNNSATSDCTTEPVTVSKDSPTLATQLKVSPGGADISNPIAIGTTLYDTASLTGAAGTPGGSITYKVYSDDACSTLVEDVTPTTATLSGGVIPDSKTRTFNAAGDFWYRAHWTGDSNNNAADSVCTDEPVTVSQNTSGITTAQNLIPNDDATLTGLTAGAGGTVVFKLFDPSDATCSGTPALTQTVNVSGNGKYSTTNTTFIASTVGTWNWLVVYSGDSNNGGSTSDCGVEHFTITNQ